MSASSASGFSFKNCYRNAVVLEKLKVKAPEPDKTGTTIAGIVFKVLWDIDDDDEDDDEDGDNKDNINNKKKKFEEEEKEIDGVVLGADTRATAAPMIVDGDCKKIHFLAENIYVCGAGICADVEQLTRLVSANLELMRLDDDRLPRVRNATRMLKQMLFRHGGQLCAELIIGGVDATGPHINCVHQHGSSDVLPFASLGSGAYNAMAVLESGFKENMGLRAAKNLVRDSIQAGIDNDLGSGSKIELIVIQKDHVSPFTVRPAMETKWNDQYLFKTGTTAILKETVEDLKVIDDRKSPIVSDDGSDDEGD